MNHPNISGILHLSVLAALTTALPAAAPAQGGRDAWWRPASAAEWKKPCLVEWQRSIEDAQAIAKATGRPILVVVNMDGEPASEHYAGVQYRDPEFAKLTQAFVPIVMSVNRHSARDYDERGRRIPCPRFGRITCGEHIALEPVCYDKFFEKQRYAPRHIGAPLEGKKTFDCFLNPTAEPVISALKKNGGKVPSAQKNDKPALARMTSRDAGDRDAVEAAYVAGDAAARKALLEAARAHPEAEQVDLLRLALRDEQAEIRKIAQGVLAQTVKESGVMLVAEALRTSRDSEERKPLLEALARLSKGSARARTATIVYRALGAKSKAVNADAWAKALAGAKQEPQEVDFDALERQMTSLQKKSKADGFTPADALELASSLLTFAEERMRVGKGSALLFEDAKRAVADAEKRGAQPAWKVHALAARVAADFGDIAEAQARAKRAVSGVVAEATSPGAAVVLSAFASACVAEIQKANEEFKEWSSDVLTDAHAAYSALLQHPMCTDAQAAAHVDLLLQVDAPNVAAEVVQSALKRFPESALLHERFRARVLEEKGLEGLEPAYEAMVKANPELPGLQWFAGLATLVTAEFHKKAGRDTQATDCYSRSIDRFNKSADAAPTFQATADHYVALALAGRARIEFEADEVEKAVADLIACVDRRAESAGTDDGLGRAPVDTMRAVRVKLRESKRDDLLAKLEKAIDQLDEEHAAAVRGVDAPPASQPGNK